MPRVRRLAPEEAVSVVAAVLSIAYTVAIYVYAHRNGSLRGDDLAYFSDARQRHFLDFVRESMDVHAVPLHRATTWLVTAAGKIDYLRLLAGMVALHVLGVVLLYRALQAFAPNPGNAVATFWYATFVENGVQLLWFTSAEHRLPYIALSAFALYAYARFRRDHTARWAAGTVLSVIAALGFFEKGVITALLLAAIEAALFHETDPRDRRKNALLLGVLGVLCALFIVAWRRTVGDQWATVSLKPYTLWVYAFGSFRMLLSGTVGRVNEWIWPALIFWAVLVYVTVRRAPRTALLWAGCLLVVTASLMSTGVSVPRVETWGLILPYYAHRYYPDVMFDVVVFFALVWQRAFPSGASALRGMKSRRLSAASAIMAMTALALVSIRGSFKLMRDSYADTIPSRRYIDEVVTNLDALESAHQPLLFVEGTVPKYLNPLGGPTARHSVLVRALGYDARFYEGRAARRKHRTVYRINDDGRIGVYSAR